MGTNLELLAQEAAPQKEQGAIPVPLPASEGAPQPEAPPAQPLPPPSAIPVPVAGAPAAQQLAAPSALAVTPLPAASNASQGSQLVEAALVTPGSAAGGEVQKTRAAIVDEVDRELQEQLESQTDAGLAQWLSQLQTEATAEARKHQLAKERLKEVDNERGRARDAYRADQQNSAKQNLWKARVADLKDAQAGLKAAREASYRAAAAVDAVLRQQKIRAGTLAPGSTATTAKRKRMQAPEERCPYCEHTYTVRDGLSSKVDEDGERLHLRKCQCREKTPPCRNCPKCRHNNDIMSISDQQEQHSTCQLKFKCEICSCKCPGAGKWVESNEESRQSYALRTGQRHGQLQQLGWNGSISVNATFTTGHFLSQHASPLQAGQDSGGKSAKRLRESRRTLKRLPHDIRMDLQQMQVPEEELAKPIAGSAGSAGHQATPGGGNRSATDGDMLVIKPTVDGLTASLSPSETRAGTPPLSRALQLAPPPLADDLLRLVDEVFLEASGVEGSAAVRTYLQGQRVRTLGDLKYLELAELKEALLPSGLTSMLLNKFLSQAEEARPK